MGKNPYKKINKDAYSAGVIPRNPVKWRMCNGFDISSVRFTPAYEYGLTHENQRANFATQMEGLDLCLAMTAFQHE
ncbi:hypothetical protein [Defluviitalea phaphyphila]|uniref:hypothetical protein n=1 Tax=Defluviitalea phaphyphila TaxID=1473580 RepID=UPI0007300495|nr:hypothetical protein [Defluviitalea phaphyphila]